ncbi:MAG: autotransporter-associated beta strand repeat-containing protein [Kiritimatiellia bacterium]|jgi:autotransporter-associated beta strand protein
MKSLHALRLVCAFWIAAAWPAAALTLYWDADGDASNNHVNGTGLGGAGAWGGVGLWWDGASATNQDWVSGSKAVFTGAPGIVTVGSTTAALEFGASGYEIQASGRLTLTHASGEAATMHGKPIEFDNATDVSWPGSVTGGNGTGFEKKGAGKLDIALVSVVGTYAPVTLFADAGKVTYTSDASGGVNHTYFTMEANTRLDVGKRIVQFRLFSMHPSAIMESSQGGGIACSSQYDDKTVAGTLQGNLVVQCNSTVSSGRTFSISGDNTHSGGFQAVAGSAWISSGPTYVDSDTGLGSGPVVFFSTDTRASVDLRFRSASPSIGSLESTYRSTKNRTIYLGRNIAPINNTELSIGALDTDTVYNDFITDYAADGATGSVRKVGSGYLVLTEAMTYAGRTTVEAGTLQTVKKDAFAAGTLKYSCVSGSPTITITTGSTSLLALGQLVNGGTGVPVGSVVRAISGDAVTLDRNATANASNQNLSAHLASASIGSDILVNGGTFNGSGTVVYDFGAGGKPLVLASGTLDISRMPISFTGSPTAKAYILVDYSAGGTFIGATNDDTADSFASATNAPEGYKWNHDATAKLVVLEKIPLPTVIVIR